MVLGEEGLGFLFSEGDPVAEGKCVWGDGAKCMKRWVILYAIKVQLSISITPCVLTTFSSHLVCF